MVAKIKIFSVIGTRPDIIKMSPLIELLNHSPRFIHKTIFTSQHKDLGKKKLHEFNLSPEYIINIKNYNMTITNLISYLTKEIDLILLKEQPDYLLVHGDTITALSATLNKFGKKCKIIHIEAGLRTHNINFPYPEEYIRSMIARVASHHFAPTRQAKQNLIDENIKENIYVVGNTIADMVKKYNKKRVKKSNQKNIFITSHRREHWDSLPSTLLSLIQNISKTNKDIKFTILKHPNPKFKQYYNKLKLLQNVEVIEDIPYKEMMTILRTSNVIVSDSCGIQEEANILGKPILIPRNETERPEGVENASGKIVTINLSRIKKELRILLNSWYKRKKMQIKSTYLGDGTSSKQIFDILEKL